MFGVFKSADRFDNRRSGCLAPRRGDEGLDMLRTSIIHCWENELLEKDEIRKYGDNG